MIPWVVFDRMVSDEESRMALNRWVTASAARCCVMDFTTRTVSRSDRSGPHRRVKFRSRTCSVPSGSTTWTSSRQVFDPGTVGTSSGGTWPTSDTICCPSARSTGTPSNREAAEFHTVTTPSGR